MNVTVEESGAAPASAIAAPEERGRRRPGLIVEWWRWLGSVATWWFGVLVIWVGLAVLSVVPILNLLSLGYLLQASGNVARSGRFRDGFIGVRQAAVVGRMVAGVWLVFWPVRFCSGLWKDAQLVAPGSAGERMWHGAVVVLTVLTVWHAAWACIRGGKPWHFLWPAPVRFFRWLSEEGQYAKGRDALWSFFGGWRLPHYLWLGGRGFAGAVLWLAGPVGLLMVATELPEGLNVLLSLVGAFGLMVVVLYLPFLQAQFACSNRFASLFAVKEVRRLFRRAPIAFWVALVVTLLFALPLYLLKIELTPEEVAWLPSILFVAFIFPARLLTGWAVCRARRREQPRHGLFRWGARLTVLPVVGLYVLLVYFTQFLSWNGTRSLLEQHIFLVPAPLIQL